jgi:anti-sigma regulatory factor (Ser/Thr protein kinase)
MAECRLHEALLNMAFADLSAFQLVCPYDMGTLDEGTIDDARGSHPTIACGGQTLASDTYEGATHADALFRSPLTRPTADVAELRFAGGPLHDVRRFVAEHARAAGIDGARVDDVVLAASEVASNSIVHGGGSGLVRTWRDDTTFVCELLDSGRIDDPLAGRRLPPREQPDGRGLWMANELCDLVQVRSLDTGVVVRLHMHLR